MNIMICDTSSAKECISSGDMMNVLLRCTSSVLETCLCSETCEKVHVCWNGDIKLSAAAQNPIHAQIWIFSTHIYLSLEDKPPEFTIWMSGNGINGKDLAVGTNLRVVERVAPPDDAAPLLHVQDVRRALQQMGLFQTFTCHIIYCRFMLCRIT